MKLRFFDFEVTPNWWLCVFGDYPDTSIDLLKEQEQLKNNFIIVNSDMPDAKERLLNLLREEFYIPLYSFLKYYQ